MTREQAFAEAWLNVFYKWPTRAFTGAWDQRAYQRPLDRRRPE